MVLIEVTDKTTHVYGQQGLPFTITHLFVATIYLIMARPVILTQNPSQGGFFFVTNEKGAGMEVMQGAFNVFLQNALHYYWGDGGNINTTILRKSAITCLRTYLRRNEADLQLKRFLELHQGHSSAVADSYYVVGTALLDQMESDLERERSEERGQQFRGGQSGSRLFLQSAKSTDTRRSIAALTSNDMYRDLLSLSPNQYNTTGNTFVVS